MATTPASTTFSNTNTNTNSSQQSHGHSHGHIHGHIHREAHDDHFHPLPHRSAHTVIHALRTGAHPPHHHEHGHTRKHLISRPKARQYFSSNGDLHKMCDLGVPRAAGKFELFLDLLYIGLCANFAEDMIHHPKSGAHLLKYLLIFVPAWRIWVDLTVIMNQYFSDDLFQRVLIVWIMILMLLFGNNAIYIDTSLGALRITVAAFMLARFSICITNLLYSLTVTHHRFQLRFQNISAILLLPIYTPLFLPASRISTPCKIVITIIGLIADISIRYITGMTAFHRYFNLAYTTAVDIEHHIDRMSAFFIIVLGEFLYGLVWASPAAQSAGKFLRAALALIIAWELCWLYVAADGSPENQEAGVHALRWRGLNGALWFFLHLPLSAALLITGDICAVFVSYGDLTAATYSGGSYGKRAPAAEAGAPKFPSPSDLKPLLWLFCGGLALGIACLYVIALLHHEADEDEDTKCIFVLPMWMRRCMRFPCAIIIACLPLGFQHNIEGDGLTVTGVMAICAALLGAVVAWEMVGGLDRQWTVLERESKCCRMLEFERELLAAGALGQQSDTTSVGFERDGRHQDDEKPRVSSEEISEIVSGRHMEEGLARVETRRTRRESHAVPVEDISIPEPKPGEKGCEKIRYVKGEGGCC